MYFLKFVFLESQAISCFISYFCIELVHINQCAIAMLFSTLHFCIQLTVMQWVFSKIFSGRYHRECHPRSTLASSFIHFMVMHHSWADYCQNKWSLPVTASFELEKYGILPHVLKTKDMLKIKICTGKFTSQWINTFTNDKPTNTKKFYISGRCDLCLW